MQGMKAINKIISCNSPIGYKVTSLLETNGLRQKSDEKEDKHKIDVQPVVECDKLEMSGETYTSLRTMPESAGYKHLQTAHRGTHYMVLNL